MSDTFNAPPRDLAASPRIFDNPLLDRLSRIDHRVPLIVYGPIVAALAAWSAYRLGPATTLGGALAGYVLWTLVEYFGHRFVFHWELKSKFGARLHFLIHGIHHDYPSDPLRLVMPLLMSAPIMTAAALLIWALAGGLAPPLLAGFIAGYVGYDMVHYHVHHAEAKTAFGRYLRTSHMLHHFRDPERGYGVSAPWWDVVFGTAWKA